jgi:polyhydroxyalkanoate synthase subunit PhaC
MRLSVDNLVDSAANAWDLMVGGGVADLSRTSSSIIDEGPQRTVRRYRAPDRPRPLRHAPVLLVPPLAAPASCFDLRKGCSIVEHLLARGYPTYLVDYGAISFEDRDLGLEHWVNDVIPKAVQAVSEDAGGQEVQVVGWCLGGIMSLLATAGHRELPISSMALIASPFDFEKVSLMAPIRRLADLTGGRLVSGLYRALGGAPATLVSLGFRATAIDRYVTKPIWIARNLENREVLAHMEAIDDYMANMLAYPGRTFGQLYHRFFRVNELAQGKLELTEDREIDLAAITEPVLVVAGKSDVLAPVPAVLAVEDLLPNAAEVEMHTAPGGHLGVLTGRGAMGTTWQYLDEFLARHDKFERKKDERAADEVAA